MDHGTLRLIIWADAPSALIEVCGLTLLERLLRQLERLDFRQATILSTTPEAIRGELARPSWARAQLSVDVKSRAPGQLTVGDLSTLPGASDFLVMPGDIYCDSRLLAALIGQEGDAAVIDPTRRSVSFSSSCPVRLSGAFLDHYPDDKILYDMVAEAVAKGTIATIDAGTLPTYIKSMRRDVRPLFLCVTPESRGQAEQIILDAAQKGALDLPAYVHAPIETAIVARLCRFSVTPNGVTICGFFFGLLATLAFFSGHFFVGLVIALIFGVIDGLDGKLARVKVETTPRGEWEHRLDFFLEYSWYLALAFGLRRLGLLPTAYVYAALLLGSDIVDRLAKAQAKHSSGRHLDDFSPIDRFFRLITGRRNIYIWLLALGSIWRGWADAYKMIAVWGLVSAAVHVIRAILVSRHRRATGHT